MPILWTFALTLGLAALGRSTDGDLFGVSLAAPGDVNGDGVPDLLVGEPWDSRPAGRGPGRVVMLSGADGTTLWQRVGRLGAERFGLSARALGDLDGDGVGDVVVGAAGAPGLPGAVQALSGRDGATLWRVPMARGGHLLEWWTAAPSPALARLPDVDGDGTADLAVGLPLAGGGRARPETGRVVLLSGAGGEVLAVREGAVPGARLGVAVVGLDDVDGDGAADVLVSAVPRRQDEPSPAASTLWILSGVDLRPLAERSVPEHALGLALAPVGDRNGDGLLDVVAGRPFAPGQDALVLVSGRDLGELASWPSRGGPSFGASLGRRGPHVREVRGVLAACPRSFDPEGAPGAWWLPLAAQADDTAAALGLRGCNAPRVDDVCAQHGDSHFGVSLVELGDVNADGVGDFAVGSATLRGRQAFPGAVRVFDGRDGRSLWHVHRRDV